MALLLAPTMIILENDQNSIAIELNEDENNKEEKKEINENDSFLMHHHKLIISSLEACLNLALAFLTYPEVLYSNTIEVFLPPPKTYI